MVTAVYNSTIHSPDNNPPGDKQYYRFAAGRFEWPVKAQQCCAYGRGSQPAGLTLVVCSQILPKEYECNGQLTLQNAAGIDHIGYGRQNCKP